LLIYLNDSYYVRQLFGAFELTENKMSIGLDQGYITIMSLICYDL